MNNKPVSGTIVKKLLQKYKNTDLLSHDDWLEVENCECGGPVFKYHDITSNVFVAKCGYVKEILEIEPKTKKRTLVPAKKQPCAFMGIFRGDKPDYSTKHEYSKNEVIDYNKKLEDTLRSKFRYYHLSNNYLVLQEIDYLVSTKLFRKKRYVEYDSGNVEISRESVEDFEKRIFRIPIIDKSIRDITGITDKLSKFQFVLDSDESAESESGGSESDKESEPGKDSGSESDSDSEHSGGYQDSVVESDVDDYYESDTGYYSD